MCARLTPRLLYLTHDSGVLGSVEVILVASMTVLIFHTFTSLNGRLESETRYWVAFPFLLIIFMLGGLKLLDVLCPAKLEATNAPRS